MLSRRLSCLMIKHTMISGRLQHAVRRILNDCHSNHLLRICSGAFNSSVVFSVAEIAVAGFETDKSAVEAGAGKASELWDRLTAKRLD